MIYKYTLGGIHKLRKCFGGGRGDSKTYKQLRGGDLRWYLRKCFNKNLNISNVSNWRFCGVFNARRRHRQFKAKTLQLTESPQMPKNVNLMLPYYMHAPDVKMVETVYQILDSPQAPKSFGLQIILMLATKSIFFLNTFVIGQTEDSKF